MRDLLSACWPFLALTSQNTNSPAHFVLECRGSFRKNRARDAAKGLILLRAVVALADFVTTDLYVDSEAEARKWLSTRDPEDRPILAAPPALATCS